MDGDNDDDDDDEEEDACMMMLVLRSWACIAMLIAPSPSRCTLHLQLQR